MGTYDGKDQHYGNVNRPKKNVTYRLTRCMISIRVVFSTDLRATPVLGVIGEFATLRGLKFRTVLMILLAVLDLVLTRMDKQFNVASTTMASLERKGIRKPAKERLDRLAAIPAFWDLLTCFCPGEHRASDPTSQ